MALRLLEFSIPGDDVEPISTMLEDAAVHHVRVAGSTNGDASIQILLEAESVEAVSDQLIGRYGHRDDFRMVLLPVSATIPRIEEPEPAEEEAPGPSEEETKAEEERARVRISREELYATLTEASNLTSVYPVMVVLSTIVAAIGLIRSDGAIIVGAMVIAPLLGPNIALSFASILGDTGLARRSLRTMAVGFAVAAIVSVLIGLVIHVSPESPEIASRVGADFGHIALALAAGAAGSLAFTTGVPAALVGVMVAVALLPPLASAGLLAGSGHGAEAVGALLLFLVNVACVNLAAMTTFFLQKIRPRTWWEAEKAKKAASAAIILWSVPLLVLVALMFVGRAGWL